MASQLVSWMVCQCLHSKYLLLTFVLDSGCDLPSHLYSFSFNLNPNWSKELCEQPEILQCQ